MIMLKPIILDGDEEVTIYNGYTAIYCSSWMFYYEIKNQYGSAYLRMGR